jgi:hypothetical protein
MVKSLSIFSLKLSFAAIGTNSFYELVRQYISLAFSLSINLQICRFSESVCSWPYFFFSYSYGYTKNKGYEDTNIHQCFSLKTTILCASGSSDNMYWLHKGPVTPGCLKISQGLDRNSFRPPGVFWGTIDWKYIKSWTSGVNI